MTRPRRALSSALAVLLLWSMTLAAPDAPVDGDDESSIATLRTGWYARIETRFGEIVVRLLPEQAPQTVAHLRALAEGQLASTPQPGGESKKAGYFDGIPVTLVEAGQHFLVGSVFRRTGTVPAVFTPPEGLEGPVGFDRPGRVGIPAIGPDRFSPVQFFVTAAGVPWLQGLMPCIGEVVSGLEVVRRLTEVKAERDGRPIEPMVVEHLSVFSVGDPKPLPEPVPYKAPGRKAIRQQPRPG